MSIRTRAGLAVRDRVLLYLTGLGMGDVESLELAAECLRRARSDVTVDATAGRAMRVLGSLLRERGVDVGGVETGTRSFPALNRSPMVSKRI